MPFSFLSCARETKSTAEIEKNTSSDTILVKKKNGLNTSYEGGFYSKSYTYYWLVGKDTLDFVLSATEHEKDSTLHLRVHHEKPILFKTVLAKINQCYPLIKQNFHLQKLNSFYFNEPIYYVDLAKNLSTEYEQQFGRKQISYQKLNQFLLNSALNKQLESLVNPFGKKIEGYSIEKFHLMHKANYDQYLQNVDLAAYPEFVIDGMGVYVQLKSERKEK